MVSVLRVEIFKYMATTTTKVSRFRDQSYGWESSNIWQQQQQKYPDSGSTIGTFVRSSDERI